MRLTLTLDPRRQGALRVRVERALDYPAGHVPGLLASAVTTALAQRAGEPEIGAEDVALVPAPRLAADDGPAPRPGPDDAVPPAATQPQPEVGEARLRWRVLRALDDGATVEEAAARFVDPAQVDRWDDDAATDAHTDQLADTSGWASARREAS